MRRNVFIFFTTLAVINNANTIGQTNRISIFKTQFNTAHTLAQKTDAALSICSQSYSLNNDTLFYYASISKKLSRQIKQSRKEVMADVFIINCLIRKNLFDSALNIINGDLKQLNYKNNSDAYSKIMMQKCFCLLKANRSRTALDVAYAFLGEAEKYDDTLAQVYVKCTIGVVYRNMQQTDLAITWFQKANTTTTNPDFEQSKNEFGLYFLMGMMYNWKLNDAIAPVERLQDSLQAIYYLDKSIADSRRYENLSILARTLNVKAATVGNKLNVDAEGTYVKEAAKIYKELNDTSSMLNTISPMCFYYIDEGHPEKGITASKAGIKMALLSNSFPVIDLYDALGQCYYAAGDYVNYSATLNSIIRLKDSTYNANSEQYLAELNARYEDQKKENIIIQQKLDITSKKYSILLISIATGLLIIGILLIYRFYNRKQKKMKQQQIAAVASGQEAERKRISADLHDNIGAYAAAAASSISSINARDDQSTRQLGFLQNNIRDMIAQLNDSIWALNKKEVLLTGVSDRFKTFVQKLEPAYPQVIISIIEEIEKDFLLTSFQALHLFRIMQEGLNNALRHSCCTIVNITIQSLGNFVSISIDDDGKGMPIEKTYGNGIGNLKFRAKELGWTAKWNRNEKGGTKVVIQSGST